MTNNTMMKMTNKDATECIKANICYKQSCCNDGICKSTDDRPCAIDMAMEALEKQEPKKVEWTLDHAWGVEQEVPVCPSCGYYLTPIQFIDMNICEQTGHCEFLKVSYCEHCSQAIDWSEEE